MNRVSGWFRSRVVPRHGQTGQAFVEFGLIVAVLAIVGIAGLAVLGRAEEGYFIPLQNDMAQAAPVGTDDVVHPTDIPDFSCTPTLVILGSSTSCTVKVRDTWGTIRTPPGGTVQLLVSGAPLSPPVTCGLSQDVGNPDPAVSTCTLVWSPGAGDLPSASVSAKYTATDGRHGDSTSASLTLTIVAPLNFLFGCSSAWQGTPNKMEVGQPLVCALTVKEQLSGNPAQPGLSVTVSSDPGSGVPTFSCFLNDNPSSPGQHSAAAANMTADPGCVPQPGLSYTCTVVAAGLCTRLDAGGAKSFVYRRNYDDSGNFLTTDHLLATAASVSQSGSSAAITIISSLSAHDTEPLVKCANATKTASEIEGSVLLRTDIQFTTPGPSSVVSCVASVIDIAPNTAMDYPTCRANGPACNIDFERPHAPLGTLTVKVYNHKNDPEEDEPPDKTLTCSPLHLLPRPVNVPVHPFGAGFHASWCQLANPDGTTPTLGAGTWDISVHYDPKAGILSDEHVPSDGPSASKSS